jgi:hypothetical protein
MLPHTEQLFQLKRDCGFWLRAIRIPALPVPLAIFKTNKTATLFQKPHSLRQFFAKRRISIDYCNAWDILEPRTQA